MLRSSHGKSGGTKGKGDFLKSYEGEKGKKKRKTGYIFPSPNHAEIFIFKNILLLIMYLCVGVCRCFQVPGCQSPLEVELLEVVSPLMWVLGTELKLFVKTIWTLTAEQGLGIKSQSQFLKMCYTTFFLLKMDEAEIKFWFGHFINQVIAE